MGRDVLLEDATLRLGCEMAERCHNVLGGSFARLVRDRLELGEQRFGDAFETRDNLVEALEEPPDAAAYALLELDRLAGRVGDEGWQELRMRVVAVIAAAAHLDRRLRDLVATRDSVA